MVRFGTLWNAPNLTICQIWSVDLAYGQIWRILKCAKSDHVPNLTKLIWHMVRFGVYWNVPNLTIYQTDQVDLAYGQIWHILKYAKSDHMPSLTNLLLLKLLSQILLIKIVNKLKIFNILKFHKNKLWPFLQKIFFFFIQNQLYHIHVYQLKLPLLQQKNINN
jgi:hypothetical protein